MRNKAAWFILLIAVLSILMSVAAAQAFSGAGSGTEADPYIITDVNQLQEMNDDLDAWYKLGNDIDASATRYWNEDTENLGSYLGFIPIGMFTGHFDGNGHKIIGLYTRGNGSVYIGLFGYIYETAEITDVGLVDVDIENNTWDPASVGGLAGVNAGVITDCYSTGSVVNFSEAGGLIGWNYGKVSNSYFAGSVSGGICVGGLVGGNDTGTISNCSSTGSVSGSGECIGGLAGNNGGTITNSYSTGAVIGCWRIGGLLGSGDGETCNDCFWDIQTSGQTTSACGTGKTTAEMKQKATFTNWDFDTVWDILENVTYPYLRDTLNPALPVKGIDVSSWQGCEEKGGQDIDWSQVYGEGYRFALVRASWWDSGVDKCFVTNMENGHTAGMLMGAYHFAYPEYTDAGSEARHFFNVAKNYLKEGYLMPALDIENDPDSGSYPYNLGPEGLSDWVNKWMDTVQALARQELHTEVEPMLYVNRTYANFLDEHLADVYDLWIAHPKTPTCNPDGEPDTKKWNNWAFWQYYDPRVCGDNSGYVPGIEGPVDLDVFNGDMSRLNTFKISAWQPDFWILYHLCSPADMVLTDPDGLIISKELNQIPGAAYVKIDIDQDGDLDKEISIPHKKVGYYQITIVPEPNALPDDTYSLEVTIDGQTMVLAEDVQIQEIPAEPYIFESKLCAADFDTDGDVDFADYGVFALRWMDVDCNYPDWCGGTDLDYNKSVDFIDLGIFADNWLWEKIIADFDIDGDVDFADYVVFANHWMDDNCDAANDYCEGTDLDELGTVDIIDLGIFAESWLAGV